LCAALAVLAVAACSGDPLGRDVVTQARPGDQIAFDVVKIDDAVVTTLAAQEPPEFHLRFKPNQPPPDIKIAVGDLVSVVIWESAANGLFGNSLTELSFPAGASARLLTGQQTTGLGGIGLSSDLTAAPETLQLLFGGAAGLGGAAAGLAAAAGAAATGATDQSATLAAVLGAPSYDALSVGAATTALPTPGGVATFGGAAGGGASFGAATGGGGAASATPRPAAGPDTRREQRLESLLELATQTGRPGTRIPDQPVGSDGAINIPHGRRLEVACHTAA